MAKQHTDKLIYIYAARGDLRVQPLVAQRKWMPMPDMPLLEVAAADGPAPLQAALEAAEPLSRDLTEMGGVANLLPDCEAVRLRLRDEMFALYCARFGVTERELAKFLFSAALWYQPDEIVFREMQDRRAGLVREFKHRWEDEKTRFPRDVDRAVLAQTVLDWVGRLPKR